MIIIKKIMIIFGEQVPGWFLVLKSVDDFRSRLGTSDPGGT